MASYGPAVTKVSSGLPEGRRLGHVRSLDGLRAIAIAAVFGVHLGDQNFPGGTFGVDLFFVLSGFLITCGLLSSIGRGVGIPFRSFYTRRARRLLPALFLLLAVYLCYMVLFTEGKSFTAGGETVAGALVYVSNWFPVLGYAPPWGLDHLWSLAVEEQFYLVWPLVLWAMIRRGITQRTCMIITAAGAVASMALRAGFYAANHDHLLGYYSTFTRADGILLGCLIAQVYVWRVPLGTLGRVLRSKPAGYLALAALIACFTQFGVKNPNTYYFGMSLAVLIAGVLLCNQVTRIGTAEAPSVLDRVLGSAPLVAIGKRSYSLYLWQNLVMFFLRGPLDGSAWWWPANIAVSVACAEFSYRFVELRFLRPAQASEVRSNSTASPHVASNPHVTSLQQQPTPVTTQPLAPQLSRDTPPARRAPDRESTSQG